MGPLLCTCQEGERIGACSRCERRSSRFGCERRSGGFGLPQWRVADCQSGWQFSLRAICSELAFGYIDSSLSGLKQIATLALLLMN